MRWRYTNRTIEKHTHTHDPKPTSNKQAEGVHPPFLPYVPSSPPLAAIFFVLYFFFGEFISKCTPESLGLRSLKIETAAPRNAAAVALLNDDATETLMLEAGRGSSSTQTELDEKKKKCSLSIAAKCACTIRTSLFLTRSQKETSTITIESVILIK